jgi:hypothetical protein
MESRLTLDILPQPDGATCGPTCLHAVYRYFGDEIPLEQVIRETGRLEEGGTLGVFLGCHALQRGYDATIYTYNLQEFDPTWFHPRPEPLVERLKTQMQAKDSAKLRVASRGYIEFLQRGGQIRMEDLTGDLIRKYLNRGVPILAGLSATYLYREPREIGPTGESDPVRGEPAGHFVMLCGYDRENRQVLVADPFEPNPLAPSHRHYLVDFNRLVCAILLGILTHDANLLILQPRRTLEGGAGADADRHQ